MSVEETDNITFSCYSHSPKDVTWLHNDERVVHYKKDGSVNHGKGYEGRASLEKNCFKSGDFSLTILNVSKADAGIYRCFEDDETAKGNPHAYVLHVNGKTGKIDYIVGFNIACCFTCQLWHNNNLVHLIHAEKHSGPGDQTQPNCNEAALVIYKTCTIVLGLVLGLILVVGAIYWITIKLHNRQPTPAPASQKSEESTPEDDRMLMSDKDTTPPTNERQPVQESHHTENKSSGTQPFV